MKFEPQSLSEFIGQSDAIEKFISSLKAWKKGKAIFIWGPTGIGKTEIVRILARQAKMDLIEVNASDSRTDKKIEELLGATIKQKSLFSAGKIILIDELDGMSGGDRGGVTGIVKIIKQSLFPVVIIADNPYTEKLYPLRSCCALIQAKKPSLLEIETYLKRLCYKHSIQAEPETIKKIALNSRGDVRAALIDLENLSENKYIDTYREKDFTIFEVLQKIFRSKNFKDTIEAIEKCDKTPEDVMWWIEENLPAEFADKKEFAEAFNLLSRADLNSGKRLAELLSCFSCIHKGRPGFTSYRPSKKTFFSPSGRDLSELAGRLHCSKGKVAKEMCFLKMFAEVV